MLSNVALPFVAVAAADDDGGFHGPSIDEFFPPALLFEGTPFELNRLMLIRLIVTALLVVWFVLATRRLRIVPSRGQAVFESLFLFVRNVTRIGS